MSRQQESTNQTPQKPKIGQGALMAAFRQGLKELGNIIAAFPGHSPLVEEPGQLGRATQQSISRQTGASQPVHFNQTQPEAQTAMHDPEMNPNQAEPQQETSVMDDLVRNAEEQAAYHEPEQDQEMEH